MVKYTLPELPYDYSALEPFWKLADWSDVARRFSSVRTLDLAL